MTPVELNDMMRGYMMRGYQFRHGKRRRTVKNDTRTREEMRNEWQELKKKFKVL